MAGDLLVSGSTLVDEQGNATDLTLRGSLTLAGAASIVKTSHDALYAFKPDMESSGTAVTEGAQDVGMPRWSLADAATQRVKWVWPIPVGWNSIAVRWGWCNESVAAGDVVWQFSYRHFYLGDGDLDAGVMTDIAVGALTATGQYDFNYALPASTAAVATPNGGLADKPFMLCSLSRLGASGSDTLAGAVAVFVATATRVS